ncbi:MAG: hypothetical protein Q7K54_00945 [Candidatus Parcubacteria bacterium]|nr:hypothetical protein [Candidatus Parcubacteria bacterium]
MWSLEDHIKDATFSGILVEAPETILYSGQGVVVSLAFDDGKGFISAKFIESENRIEGLRVWIIHPGGTFFDLTDECGIIELDSIPLSKLLGCTISGRLVWLEERKSPQTFQED